MVNVRRGSKLIKVLFVVAALVILNSVAVADVLSAPVPPRAGIPGGKILAPLSDRQKADWEADRRAGTAGNRVMVKFKSGTGKAAAARTERRAGSAGLIKTVGPRGQKNIRVLRLKPGVSVAGALTKLRANPAVAYAVRDGINRALLTPNDPSFSQQWGLHNTGQTINGQAGTADADVDAPEAWDKVGSPADPAVVAVIDTGLDLNHPDLSSRLWQNPGEIAGNGLDDDGNGFVDDINGHNWAGIGQYASADSGLWLGSDDPDPVIKDAAQSFRGNGGYISSVGFAAAKYGSPPGPVTVSIRSSLGGDDLASAVVPASAFPDYFGPGPGWINADFSSPIKVENGTTYYLVFSTAGQDYDNCYVLGARASNVFADGMLHADLGGWNGYADLDFAFELTFDGVNGRGGQPRDDQGHGTHVGGIVAAAGNDANGVAGLAGIPDNAARLMGLRALDTWGSGYDSDIIEAIYYAADNGADVINMSLGGTEPNALFQTAVDDAEGMGVVVIAAAGNDGDTSMNYPAGYTNVLGVAATDNRDNRASFSNYNSSVDVSAPGVDIFSTAPTYAYDDALWYGDPLDYRMISGTSMATPMTAGLAALLRAVNPTLTPADLRQVIQDNADDKGVPGRDNYFGHGRINAANALDDPRVDTVPPVGAVKINNDAAFANSTGVTLNLSATDAGLGVDQMHFKNDGGAWSDWQNYAATANWNLAAGDGTKKVWAQFKDKAGNESAAVYDTIVLDTTVPGTIVPDTTGPDGTVPDTVKPVALLTSPAFSTKISKTPTFKVKWSGSDSGSGVASYNVRYKLNLGGAWKIWKLNTTATSAFFKGQAGRTYYLQARAKDKTGNLGAWSTAKRTIVPYDNNKLIAARRGFGGTFSKASSKFYEGTVRYSTKKGHSVIYKFKGKRVALVTTKAKNRSNAKIYIDGKYVKTVKAYSATFKPRQTIFSKAWKKGGTHTIKVVNLGTPGRSRFDLDGLAVGR